MAHFRLPQHQGPALRANLIVQLIVLFLTAIVLDGGMLSALTFAAFAGYWLGVLLISLRPADPPRPTDLLFLRWGTAVLIATGIVYVLLV